MSTNSPGRTNRDAAIRELAADNRSGAAELLRRAARAIALMKEEVSAGLDQETAHRLVHETAAALIQAQPEMAPMAHLASFILTATAEGTDARQIAKLAAQAAAEFLGRTEAAMARTIAHGAELISDDATVLTHSRSSTVLKALVEASRQGRRVSVIATESRPLFEGRALAAELALAGIEVAVVADAAAAVAIECANIVLVGADRVTPENVVNKIGTRLIALSAAERKVPIYAMADSSKFIDAVRLNSSRGPDRNPDELWPGRPSSVAMLNRYFEPTPLELFTGIINEAGALTPDQARRVARARPVNPALVDLDSR